MRTVFHPIECMRRDILGALIDRLEVVDDAHRCPLGACAAHVPLGVDDNEGRWKRPILGPPIYLN